jgi:uncharacterized membrane protein YczE
MPGSVRLHRLVWRTTRGDARSNPRWRPILHDVHARDHFRAFGRWASTRAWSRAGAIAQILATGTPRRVAARTSRVALFAVGSVLIGASVAVMLWNQLGPGPLDVFIGAVRTRTGLPLTLAVWATVFSMLAFAWVLGRRPGWGSVAGPIVVGPVMQLVLTQLQVVPHPSSIVVRIAVQVAAVAFVGLGAGAMISSGLGAGSGELLAAAASDRSGHPEPRVRAAFELSWLVIGVALGGPAGLGTVIAALIIGPAVAHGHRAVESLVGLSRRQLAYAAGL